MTKYLVVYKLDYIKKCNSEHRYRHEEIFNDFFFFERYPFYSVIMEKLMKKHDKADCTYWNLVILGIYPLENEPSDIEGKEVIKL